VIGDLQTKDIMKDITKDIMKVAMHRKNKDEAGIVYYILIKVAFSYLTRS
jgi:hypothetical protein